MAQKKAKLRSGMVGIAKNTPVKIDVKDFEDEIDNTTRVVFRPYIRPNQKHRGYWATDPTLIYRGVFGNNGAALPPSYTPKEKGFHVLVLTTVEGGVAHTFRSGVIKVF